MSFCKNCGEKLNDGQKACTKCGHAVEAPSSEKSSVKQPLSMKKKILFSAVAVFAVVVIGFIVFANNYTSAEATEERFMDALKEGDADRLAGILEVEKGEDVPVSQAKAYLSMYKQYPEEFLANRSALYEVTKSGRWLGIFSKHVVKVEAQFLAVDLPFEDIDVSLNGEKMKASSTDDGESLYGPLAPGVYNLKAVYTLDESEFIDEFETELISLDPEDRRHYESVTYEIDMIEFYSESDNVSVLVNDKEYDLSEENVIGPFTTDGSTTYQIVSSAPWGKVTSEPVTIDSSYIEVTPTANDESLHEQWMELVVQHREQSLQAVAMRDASLLTVGTDEDREELQVEIDSYLDWDEFYAASLKRVDFDFSDVRLEEYNGQSGVAFSIQTNYESGTYTRGEEPDLNENNMLTTVFLPYNEEEKTWSTVDYSYTLENGWYDFYVELPEDGVKEMAGSGEVYQLGDETVASISNERFTNEDFEGFLYDFALSQASNVNYDDPASISDYFVYESEARTAQIKYLQGLIDNGTDIYFDNIRLLDVEKVDGSTWNVLVSERFEIIKSDEDPYDTEYEMLYTIVEQDGELLISAMESQ